MTTVRPILCGLLAAGFLAGLIDANAHTLTVRDPTGTPLNVRNARNEIVCTVRNGSRATTVAKDGAFAYTGKEWTVIKSANDCLGKAWSQYLQ